MPLGSFNATIVNTAGDVVPNAQVQVRRTSDNGLATLFSNAAGTAMANPFNADGTTAFAQFFAERGTYTVAASTGSGTVTWTVDVVSAFEPPLTREIANGSAAAPSIAFASDPNTGFYRIGADQLGLAEGGVDRGRLYARKNILGTVSQTAGVPTGAAFESGTNANGTYVRFADGTQMCRLRNTSNQSIAKDATQDFTWTYPAAFISAIDVHIDFTAQRASVANGSIPALSMATYRDSMSTTQASFGLTNLNSVSSFLYTVTARGRWF